MAFCSGVCRDSPWRRWNNSLRTAQWCAYIHCAFLWRVSLPLIAHSWDYLLTRYSQPFWGDMVASRGVGPAPVRYKSLSVQSLVQAISLCLEPETKIAAEAISRKMKEENGVRSAVQSFHAHLPPEIECQVIPNEVAAWKHKSKMRLSKRAASTLLKASSIKVDDLSS